MGALLGNNCFGKLFTHLCHVVWSGAGVTTGNIMAGCEEMILHH